MSGPPLPVKFGVVSTKCDGADLFKKVVTVSVLSVFRGLVVETRVVNNGDAVRGLIGYPEFVWPTGMKLQVRGLVEVVRGVGDDGFLKHGAKLFNRVVGTAARSVRRN